MNRYFSFFLAGFFLLGNAWAVAGTRDDESYDLVERAGYVAWPDEFKMDAKVLREKNGREVFGQGQVFFVEALPECTVNVGDHYTIYRAKGHVRGGEDRRDLGILFQGVGVARILYSDSETILARVEKQYDGVRMGDGLRLQDTDRKAYIASKNKKIEAETARSEAVKGSIAHIQFGQSIAGTGDVVYLDLGTSSGLTPGMRLTVYRNVSASGEVGKLGEVEVLSAQKETATVLVVKSQIGLIVGDQILPLD